MGHISESEFKLYKKKPKVVNVKKTVESFADKVKNFEEKVEFVKDKVEKVDKSLLKYVIRVPKDAKVQKNKKQIKKNTTLKKYKKIILEDDDVDLNVGNVEIDVNTIKKSKIQKKLKKQKLQEKKQQQVQPVEESVASSSNQSNFVDEYEEESDSFDLDGDIEMSALVEDDGKYHFKEHANLLLLDSYSRNKAMLTNGRYKPKHFWKVVENEVQSALEYRGESIFPNSSQCKCRYATMMKGYKKCIDGMRKSGNSKKPLCKYFAQLDEINGEKPNIHPESVLSSSGLGNISEGVKRKNEPLHSSSTTTSASVPQRPVDENSIHGHEEPERKKRKYESTVTKSTNSMMVEIGQQATMIYLSEDRKLY